MHAVESIDTISEILFIKQDWDQVEILGPTCKYDFYLVVQVSRRTSVQVIIYARSMFHR